LGEEKQIFRRNEEKGKTTIKHRKHKLERGEGLGLLDNWEKKKEGNLSLPKARRTRKKQTLGD